MEEKYDDTLLPENFEEIAKAYAQSLKGKNFVFVNLRKEEFNLLLDEIFIIFSKIKSCINCIKSHFECKKLQNVVENSCNILSQKFGNKKPHNFRCVANKNLAFFKFDFS